MGGGGGAGASLSDVYIPHQNSEVKRVVSVLDLTNESICILIGLIRYSVTHLKVRGAAACLLLML